MKVNIFIIFSFQNLSEHKPWWKANFFIMEPVLFGTWDGVFTSCLINLIGVIIFLRMGWIVVGKQIPSGFMVFNATSNNISDMS